MLYFLGIKYSLLFYTKMALRVKAKTSANIEVININDNLLYGLHSLPDYTVDFNVNVYLYSVKDIFIFVLFIAGVGKQFMESNLFNVILQLPMNTPHSSLNLFCVKNHC